MTHQACVVWCSLAMIVVAGCDSGKQPGAASAPPAPSTATPSAATPTTDVRPIEAAPAFEDGTFRLSASAAGPYTVGTLGHFTVTLTPKGEYHVNEEYPITIDLITPDAVTAPKSSLEKSDAIEVTATTARFDVPVTPTQAGDHTVRAKVSFAVCTPETCVPDERTLELALNVR